MVRLATLDEDGWMLRSGEATHREHPDTFWIPPLEERWSLKRGQTVKLIFEIEAQNEDGNLEVNRERMWVIVAERIGPHYIGILDNDPAMVEATEDGYLVCGSEIPFLAEHVIDISDDAPADYVAERLAAPTRRWPGR